MMSGMTYAAQGNNMEGFTKAILDQPFSNQGYNTFPQTMVAPVLGQMVFVKFLLKYTSNDKYHTGTNFS